MWTNFVFKTTKKNLLVPLPFCTNGCVIWRSNKALRCSLLFNQSKSNGLYGNCWTKKNMIGSFYKKLERKEACYSQLQPPRAQRCSDLKIKMGLFSLQNDVGLFKPPNNPAQKVSMFYPFQWLLTFFKVWHRGAAYLHRAPFPKAASITVD